MSYGFIHIVVFMLINCPSVSVIKTDGYVNQILVTFKGTEKELKSIELPSDWTFDRKVVDSTKGDIYRFYVGDATNKQAYKIIDTKELLQKNRKIDKKVKAIVQEHRLKRYPKAVTINDARWSNQWHLQTSQTPSMNVYNAWDKGFTGSGVTIAILDDGLDTDHTDMADNYNSAHSYDYIYDVASPEHKDAEDGHGTNCAGVAAAVKNTDCVIGVAHDATIAGVRILDSYTGATASEEALALTHALSHVDIYSNSWGPSDDGTSFSDITAVQLAAFQRGVTEGRGGRGAIYTWASGNGGDASDDCNADGYSKSIYTIAVAAMSETTAPTWYSEHCSAIFIATYSGDDPNAQITTSGPSGTCVNDFTGTSSACPLASGIIAQTLQANSSLSWRDVKHLTVENAISSGLHANASFATNAASKKYSHYFGFGLMDAEAMVDAAPSWLGVPSYTSCSYPTKTVNAQTYHQSISDDYTVSNCFISYLEEVEVQVRYRGYYRGDVQLQLTSPSSTSSIIFSRRKWDQTDSEITWTFMSVHFWGEDPAGDWTLTLSDQSPFDDTTMQLYYWKLTFYGTITDPLAGTPTAGSLGGSCTNSDDCSSITDGGCLLSGKICVTCDNNYRIVNTFCVQDGYTGGYCSDSIPCVFSTDECVGNVCQENEDDESSSSDNTGVIAGAVVGSVALIGSGGVFVYKKFYKPGTRVAPQPTGTRSSNTTRAPVGDQPTATHFDSSQYQSTRSSDPPPSYNESISGAHPV